MTENLITIDIDGEEQDFSDYQEMVDYLAKHRINYTFNNSVIEHSIMLISKFIENIDGVFKLYTRHFRKDIFDSSKLILKIKEFLKKDDGNKISILIEEKRKDFNSKQSNFLKALESYKDKISIKEVKDEQKCRSRYMVLNTAYRIANTKDEKNFSASVNFNHEEHSKILNEHFDRVFNQSKDMQWS